MHPFHQLLTGAQSYWMDNLTRHPILPILCQDLPAVGIAFDHVTWQFQHEGIQKLIEPFDALIQSLVNKTKQSQEFLSDPAWHAR
jgi:hypothetical protein